MAVSRFARSQSRAGLLLSVPYVILLSVFGIFPALYAIRLAFSTPDGRGFSFTGGFARAFSDFRFFDTVINVALYGLAFLVPSMVVSIGLALLLQRRRPGVATAFRFVYYLPQALVGAAGVVVWLFMLNPAVSPVGPLLEVLSYNNLYDVLVPENLAVIFATIAVWTSANGILLMFAALASIPAEVLEAARLDGANGWEQAIYIKLPMLSKWVVYTLILNIAASAQLFVEPQLIAAATGGGVGTNWSPLQLAYTFSFSYGDFSSTAAISIVLLVFGGIAAFIAIKKANLFEMGN